MRFYIFSLLYTTAYCFAAKGKEKYMDLQNNNMTVRAQIVKLIPAKIIDSSAKNTSFR